MEGTDITQATVLRQLSQLNDLTLSDETSFLTAVQYTSANSQADLINTK